jgi:hypothetical protein
MYLIITASRLSLGIILSATSLSLVLGLILIVKVEYSGLVLFLGIFPHRFINAWEVIKAFLC